jgi:hypothetical protein
MNFQEALELSDADLFQGDFRAQICPNNPDSRRIETEGRSHNLTSVDHFRTWLWEFITVLNIESPKMELGSFFRELRKLNPETPANFQIRERSKI